VADNVRPPVAVRIVRPYETEEAFLESELETVGKTSVILIGAHSRPTGVILRFEVTLTSGVTVLRGEGRVLAHKESAFRGQPGLALRFTRLDPKSKALVDRAAAIREARLSNDSVRPGSMPAAKPSRPPEESARPSAFPPVPPSAPSIPPEPSLAQILTAPSPTPPPARPGAQAKKSDRRRPSEPAERQSKRPMTTTGRPAETAPQPPRPYTPSNASSPPRSSAAPSAPPSRGRSSPPASIPAPSAPPPSVAPLDEDAPRAPLSTLVDDEEMLGGVPPSGEMRAAIASAPPEAAAPSVRPEAAAPSIRPEAVAPSVAPASMPASLAPPASARAIPRPDGSSRAVSPPENRDDLLSRLRMRAAALTEEQVSTLLRSRSGA
jgi:hypothetical protein